MRCDACGKPLIGTEGHWGHMVGCNRKDCDCNLLFHEECCPDCNPKDNNEEFNVLVLTRDEITGGIAFSDFEVDRIRDWLLNDLLENYVWTSLAIIREEVMKERHVQQQ